jgi:hypothetical protein
MMKTRLPPSRAGSIKAIGFWVDTIISLPMNSSLKCCRYEVAYYFDEDVLVKNVIGMLQTCEPLAKRFLNSSKKALDLT